MPCDTFEWRGIDGTGINSYFLTASDMKAVKTPAQLKRHEYHTTTYNANTYPTHIAGTYERYQQKELTDEVLVTFGYGDGGGGPNSEFIELLRRSAKGIPGGRFPAPSRGKHCGQLHSSADMAGRALP